jgi:NDP-sugar pyrophosphorylase family protein
MKVMLLAAGRGDRMQPLTWRLPKPAIPVLGRPLALQILGRMSRYGVRRAVVNLHHLPDVLLPLLADGAGAGLEAVTFSREETLLGTAGGVRRAAAGLVGDGAFFVRNSDFLADVDLAALQEAHLRSGAGATLALAPHRPGYTDLRIDDTGRVCAIGGARGTGPGVSGTAYLFTGLQILDDETVARIPEDGPRDLVREVFAPLMGEGRLHAFVHEGFWEEFGTPESYLRGSLRLLRTPAERLREIADTDPVREIGTARVAVGPAADFHTGVDLRGGVALGLACMVNEGARLEDSVVMAESFLGPGCDLRGCIVGPGTEIPAGTNLRHVLVCSDVDPGRPLPPSVRRSGGLLIRPLDGDD